MRPPSRYRRTGSCESKEADAVLSDEAENSLSFDDELQGLLGNRAKVAVIITRLASARLFAAFCQLSDISAQCLASPQGAVAVLRNLDGDGPEAAIKDLTTVVSGMPADPRDQPCGQARGDDVPARQRSARRSRHRCCSPPPRRSSKTCCWASPTFRGCVIPAWKPSIPLSLTRDDAMKILAEHTRFGRGSSSIE